MPKNKRVPDALLSRLHGKGTMSEILDIERARLREQSAQDMQRRLSSVDAADSGTLAELTPGADTEQLTGGMAEQIFEVNRSSKSPPDAIDPLPVGAVASSEAQSRSPSLSEVDVLPFRHAADATQPVRASDIPYKGLEGLSKLSRVVGDDLSELGTIFRHSAPTVASPPHFSPEPCQSYYTHDVDPTLAFTAERNLLATIRRLTLGWGALSCQITLDMLAVASGIRNIKTLRKWLADLHNRRHIRYTPVHGDLRGSIITLTPPAEIRGVVERWWRDQAPSGTNMS